MGLYDVPKQARIRLTGKIVNNNPNVICRGTDTLTHILTHIWSRFRDKLSLLRSPKIDLFSSNFKPPISNQRLNLYRIHCLGGGGNSSDGDINCGGHRQQSTKMASEEMAAVASSSDGSSDRNNINNNHNNNDGSSGR